MDPSSQFIVPTIIDVPELIVTNEDIDFEDSQDTARCEGIWMKKLKSVSSLLPYVIGLHNIWRFPYLCYKYQGGAFQIAYTLMLILIGYPLLLMELAFGQYANEGPITIWRISPAFEGIGYVMCLISAMVAVYYNVVNAWIIHYILGSLSFGTLSWSRCDNSWNSNKCFYKDIPDLEQPLRECPTTMNNNGTTGDLNVMTKLSTPSSSTINNNINNNTTDKSIFSPGINEVSVNDHDVKPIIIESRSINNTIDPKANVPIFYAPTNCSISVSNHHTSASSSGIQSFSGTQLINGTSNMERIINTTNDILLPTNEYFHNEVLGISGSMNEMGSLNWSTLIYLALCWAIVFIVIMRGLRLNGHLTMASLIVPYLLFITLFVRAITLEGAFDGIIYYLTPKWEKFKDIDIWVDATTQIFFAISPCWGAMITLASMNKFHNNFQSNAIQIMALNYVTSIFIGLVSFSILGFMSKYSGVDLDQLIDSGQGFILMVYPEALSKLPVANLNSFIFFVILLFLGFNSQLTVIETVITTIVDTWPNKLRYRRPLILMILCASMFLLGSTMCFGNGFYILQMIDSFGATYTAMVIGIMELIALAWIYGVENFQQDIDDMIGVHRNLFPSKEYWYFMWRYLTPSLLFAIVLFTFTDLKPTSYRGAQEPNWALTLGWTYTLVCLSVVPAIAFIRFMLTPRGSFSERLSYLFKPSQDWAPSSYVSGPKLLNRHRSINDRDCDGDQAGTIYSSRAGASSPYGDQLEQDQDQESDEDLRVVDGRANYIIPEEEDDTDYGLVGTNETNL